MVSLAESDKPEIANDFYPKCIGPFPPWEVKLISIDHIALPVFLLFLLFFSLSTQPRQMGINRESRKWLENKLVVKCSRLNFYFKRNFWNRGKRRAHRSQELWSGKLRWKVRGRMLAAQIEDKRSKTLQMNGTYKYSAVNTTWHLYRKAKSCWTWLFLTIFWTKACQRGLRAFSWLFGQQYNDWTQY